MMAKSLSAAVLGLTPAVLLAQTSDSSYKQVYQKFGAVEPTEIKPTSSSAKQFGQVVAVSGLVAAVSSNEFVVDYSSSDQIGKRGRVSVFGADYLRRFKDSGVDFISPTMNDGYGKSLALWEGTMLVGAPYDSSDKENAGRAYVYFGSNFGSSQTLYAEHGEEGDYFGHSVAIVHGQNYYGSGMAVVGAYGHDHDKESTVGQGCVFVYTLDSSNVWDMVGKLEPQDFEHKNHGGFGYSLSAYGNTVAVGSYAGDTAYVFELMGHLHECPHGKEEEERDDFPSECLDDDRRHLRSLQGPPEDDKKWYTEFKYEHILTVGLEEEHKHEKEKEANSYSFGQAVALYNESGVLTLAVGAPDAMDDNNLAVGSVYVMSIMNRGDVMDEWYPKGYDHHEEDKQREEAEREAEREEREAEEEAEREQKEQEDGGERRSLQGEGDKNRFRTWNPQTASYVGDKMGNFWMLETILYGFNSYERFGHAIDINLDTLLIGNNPTTFQTGRAAMYSRSTASSSSSSPLISGPLYNTAWTYSAALKDSKGMDGDHFGYSVALDGNIAIVGAIMPDIQSDGAFGQGVAYVYDRNGYINIAPTSAPNSNAAVGQDASVSDEASGGTQASGRGIVFLVTTSFVGVALVSLCGYAIYRGSGLFSSEPAEQQTRVATMDDSGFTPDSTSGAPALKSAYTGLDTSSSHGLNRMPGAPALAPRASPKNSGASRTFTPQTQRSFAPMARSTADSESL